MKFHPHISLPPFASIHLLTVPSSAEDRWITSSVILLWSDDNKTDRTFLSTQLINRPHSMTSTFFLEGQVPRQAVSQSVSETQSLEVGFLNWSVSQKEAIWFTKSQLYNAGWMPPVYGSLPRSPPHHVESAGDHYYTRSDRVCEQENGSRLWHLWVEQPESQDHKKAGIRFW